MRRTTILLLLLGAGATALQAELVVQHLYPEPLVQVVAEDGLATLNILYEAGDLTVPGVGVRVHYDSSRLTLEGRELLFSSYLSGMQDQPDEGDDDGDPATDRRLLAAWAENYEGAWPGEETLLPLALIRLRFRTHGIFPSTQINLTGMECADCRLETEFASILIAGGGPTSTPTTTLTPSPTPTATRTPTITRTPTFGPSPTAWNGPLGPPTGPGSPSVETIPTASAFGLLVLVAGLAASALAFLIRQRR